MTSPTLTTGSRRHLITGRETGPRGQISDRGRGRVTGRPARGLRRDRMGRSRKPPSTSRTGGRPRCSTTGPTSPLNPVEAADVVRRHSLWPWPRRSTVTAYRPDSPSRWRWRPGLPGLAAAVRQHQRRRIGRVAERVGCERRQRGTSGGTPARAARPYCWSAPPPADPGPHSLNGAGGLGRAPARGGNASGKSEQNGHSIGPGRAGGSCTMSCSEGRAAARRGRRTSRGARR